MIKKSNLKKKKINYLNKNKKMMNLHYKNKIEI